MNAQGTNLIIYTDVLDVIIKHCKEEGIENLKISEISEEKIISACKNLSEILTEITENRKNFIN
jgi:hypothetical protein